MDKHEVEKFLELSTRVHPKFKPVWLNRNQSEQASLAAYFLRHKSEKAVLMPERPKILKWYCPFAGQAQFPSGHRYCINVYTGCFHYCIYCYAAGYEPDHATPKKRFEALLLSDLSDLETFNVPPAPVHLSNSTDPFQERMETMHGHTRFALESIIKSRHRFTTVTILTKNPLMPVENGCLELFKKLTELSPAHPEFERLKRDKQPPFLIEVSLAFFREDARKVFDPQAPSIENRMKGIRALREAGVPVVLRVDPLFPRSPLPDKRDIENYGLPEAQTLEDLENLVSFAKETGVLHIVYSPMKIVRPRYKKMDPTMVKMKEVYQAISAPNKPVWRGGSWRLPDALCREHILRPFFEICQRYGVKTKFCMKNLIERF